MTNWRNNENQWPVLLLAIVVFIVALKPMEDFDTFWQLQSGKFILESGRFLYRDTFSITPDAYRMEHCWLSDIIFYLHYLAGGYKLLSLLKTVIITLCGLLLYRFNVQRGGEPYLVMPVLTLCMAASIGSWAERPQLWTFLFSILYIYILHKGREQSSKAWYWLIPLMLVWANLHAGCIFGFVLIGLFLAGEIIRLILNKNTSGKVFILACISFATFGAAFINPYGSRIPMHVLAHLNLTNLSQGQQVIMEWLPPASEQIMLFYVVFVVWGLIILAKWNENDPAEIIFFCAFLYMGTSQVRHSVFVPLLAGFYLPASIQHVVRRFLSVQQTTGSRYRLVTRLCTLIALVVFLTQNIVSSSWGWGLSPVSYPVAATQFLIQNKLPSPIYNFYDWGGYLMWQLYPRYQVFVDGRNTSSETLEASNRIDNSWNGWLEDFKHYNINAVITRTCYYDSGGPVPLVDSLAKDPDWALVYRDDIAVIFLRKDEKFRNIWGKFAIPSVYVYETMFIEAERLLREDPKRTRVHLALGRSSLKLGRYADALAHYSQNLEKNPGDSESRMLVDFLTKK
ncbi:MAG: tetratricopeptide repeat protein [Deltaproteobacteria bacterium]|nr:tetratricopeptide repeat protein [Deltaproteobacteria bacterium]